MTEAFRSCSPFRVLSTKKKAEKVKNKKINDRGFPILLLIQSA
jgi:hypothetical protein